MIRMFLCFLLVGSLVTAAEAQYPRYNPMQQRIWQNMQARKAQADQQRQARAYQERQQKMLAARQAEYQAAALAEKRKRDADPKYKAAQESKERFLTVAGLVAAGIAAEAVLGGPSQTPSSDDYSELHAEEVRRFRAENELRRAELELERRNAGF